MNMAEINTGQKPEGQTKLIAEKENNENFNQST